LDRDRATVDLAVGAPYRDGTAGTDGTADRGAVFLLLLDPSRGTALRAFALESIDPYGAATPRPQRLPRERNTLGGGCFVIRHLERE
jgi:hypothetical protein